MLLPTDVVSHGSLLLASSLLTLLLLLLITHEGAALTVSSEFVVELLLPHSSAVDIAAELALPLLTAEFPPSSAAAADAKRNVAVSMPLQHADTVVKKRMAIAIVTLRRMLAEVRAALHRLDV